MKRGRPKLYATEKERKAAQAEAKRKKRAAKRKRRDQMRKRRIRQHRCVKVMEAILPLRVAPGDGVTLRLLVRSNRNEDEIRASILNLLEPMDVPTERVAEAVNDGEHGGI